ncbi:SLC13 family permease [Gordonia hankookensis]|uniref:Arsenic transporter n=1 Tax=Gordonia hankookensis TaxID=589403 RepID=A0ABR7WCZ0_9ACTN|nr:SLC13 family permease [Gordonia hankookensis]MBD1319647.1 arsenic transporter [Gordonia hankookensis]
MISPDNAFGAGVSIALLVVVIAFTMTARRLPPAVAAVPAAVLVVATGLASWSSAADELHFMAPTIGFLAAMLVVADICARTGVFAWVGSLMSRWSRDSPNRLLRIVFAAAAIVTAILSLDATIVLLTPLAVDTARRIGARVAPVGYASAHLANSASTLMPVSNLTNLIAFSATGLTFLGFTATMAAPWVVAIVVEFIVFRVFFADDLRARPTTSGSSGTPSSGGESDTPRPPRWTLTCLGILLIGFLVAEPFGIPLVGVATSGAVLMTVPLLVAAPRSSTIHVLRAANVPFLAFVAALGVVILPVRDGPLGDAVADLIPSGSGLLALLAVAALAAVLANVLNNLPATLLLVPLVADQPALVLAVLLGVNIGPNLGYFGSLATLLWRDVMHRHALPPPSRRYLQLGLLSVPPTLIAAVVALWISLQVS